MTITIGHRREPMNFARAFYGTEELFAWLIFISIIASHRQFRPVVASSLDAVVNTIIINVVDEILISFVKIIRWPINLVFFFFSPSKSINTRAHTTHTHKQKKNEMRFGKMDILRHNIFDICD